MRLVDIDDPALYEKVYCPSDNAGIEEYPRMIEWADLEAAPTVDAAPVVHGYWFLTEHEYLNCSVCGKPYYTGIETLSAALDHLEYAGGHKFCPNCGAKMDLKEEDHGR